MVRPRRGRPGRRGPSARRSSTASCRDSRAGTDDWWGGHAREPRSSRSRGARPTGSCTTTSSDHWEPGLVRGLRRARGRPPARLRRRRRPHEPAARAACPGRSRDERGRADRRRPDRQRAAHRHAALHLLPPVGALPRQPHGRPTAPDAGRAARRCTSRRARAPRRRAAGGPARLRDGAAALARARTRCAFAELRAALGADPDELGEALLRGLPGRAGDAARARRCGRSRAAGVERPVASPLARWQARTGAEVTSLAYTTVHMEEPAARLLLTLLDGTRDRAAIRAEFARAHRRAALAPRTSTPTSMRSAGCSCSRSEGADRLRRCRARARAGAARCRTAARAGRARARSAWRRTSRKTADACAVSFVSASSSPRRSGSSSTPSQRS